MHQDRAGPNRRIGVGLLRSISAGIFEFIDVDKPPPNWLPSILISQASYAAKAGRQSSSNMTATLTPLGVASE
jgi:hypothetical protein